MLSRFLESVSDAVTDVIQEVEAGGIYSLEVVTELSDISIALESLRTKIISSGMEDDVIDFDYDADDIGMSFDGEEFDFGDEEEEDEDEDEDDSEGTYA